MISFLKFKAVHMNSLVLQPAQAHLAPIITNEELKMHEENEGSFTLLEDGVPVLCGGAMKLWPGRAVMWCYMGGVSTKGFLQMHHLAKQWLAMLDFSRIELYVDYDFNNGHRWAKAMGFKVDAPRMRYFTKSGSDSTMYVLIRNQNGR